MAGSLRTSLRAKYGIYYPEATTFIFAIPSL